MSDDGYNINEAAEKLNCSVRTVRRRIKDGTLRATKVEGRFGDEYRIYLNEPISATAIVNENPENPENIIVGKSRAELQQLLKVISDLSQQNVELAKRLGAAEAKAQMLTEKLQLLDTSKGKRKGFWSRIFG